MEKKQLKIILMFIYELEHRLVKNGKNKILEDIVKIIPDEVKISSIRQSDALGLGHAILCA